METKNNPVNVKLTLTEQIGDMIYRWLHKDQITHMRLFWDIPLEQRQDYLDIADASIAAVRRTDDVQKPDVGILD